MVAYMNSPLDGRLSPAGTHTWATWAHRILWVIFGLGVTSRPRHADRQTSFSMCGWDRCRLEAPLVGE